MDDADADGHSDPYEHAGRHQHADGHGHAHEHTGGDKYADGHSDPYEHAGRHQHADGHGHAHEHTGGDEYADGHSDPTSTRSRPSPRPEHPLPCRFGTRDGDGCADASERQRDENLGGDRDEDNPWDFFDVPVPARPDPASNGTRNKAVLLNDVAGVMFYVGTTAANPSLRNGRGVSYGSLKDGDWFNSSTDSRCRYPDGCNRCERLGGAQVRSDTQPSFRNKPYRSGPPDGAVTLADVSVAMAQVGDSASAKWRRQLG